MKNGKMKHRRPITKKKSRKIFRKTASKVHKKNNQRKIMRGGIRL